VVYLLIISDNQAAGDVTVSWDVPFIGSNSHGEGAPKGFTIAHQGGNGDNAAVTFTLSRTPRKLVDRKRSQQAHG
jgi:hypothetical protein